MEAFYLLIASLLAVSGAVATLYIITFLRKMALLGKSPAGSLPKAAVILCLRGADPFLPDTLKSVLRQNYPQFTVKLMIDNRNDPSAKIVNGVIEELGAKNVEISFLKTVRPNCSLKCSSLVQAVSELDSSHEVAAFVDADIICYPNWLRELVLPLNNPDVGIATGNRWYLSDGAFWGSLVRYLWNTYVVLQMIFHQCPWGGSFAIRIKTLKETGLLEKWSLAFCEDVMMRDVLKKFGLRVHFVPALLMLNTEESDLLSFVSWIQRQFLCVRLYHAWWPYGVIDNTIFLLPHLLLSGRFLLALVTGQWYKAAIAFGIYAVLVAALCSLLLFVMEPKVQQVISAQGRKVSPVGVKMAFRLFAGMLPASLASLWALMVSCTMKRANWRGIQYNINGPFQIQLVKYRPYETTDSQDDKKSL